jgi:hypothetical protein
MKLGRISTVAATTLLALLSVLTVGVFANSQIQINNGNIVDLTAGKSAVAPCDNDVNITPIILNDGNNVWVQGFQYDNVDKPACVGYDFETRFSSTTTTSLPLFATSSISSDPYVIRVYAPDSSTNWSLGLGSQPTAEATVTQISASSFKVIFTTPVSAVTDFGKVVMAEIAHLPVGTFTNGYTQVGSATGVWYGSCFVANATRFYALENTLGLYQSTLIPAFPGSVSSVSSTRVSASAIPTSGVTWYGLGCSADGKYLAIGGTSNQISYSSDYGSTWESKTVTSIGQSGTTSITAISISGDGKVVAVSTGNTPGTFNFWVNGNFWASPSSNPDAYFQVNNGMSTVTVCGDGTTIYGGGKSASPAGVYRWQSSSITSGGSGASVNPAYTSTTFGYYIRAIACSADGKSVVIASPSNYQVYVTRNQFSTWYNPTGLSTTNQGATTKPYAVGMSSNGQFVVVGTGDQLGSDKGVTQYSTDFGQNLSNTSFINHYMQTITVTDDGGRMVTGGGVGATKMIILGSN